MRYLIILFFISFSFSANLIIRYPNLKKEYYENQIIDLNIKVITPKEMNLTFIPPLGGEVNVTRENRFIYNVKVKYKNNDEIKKLFIIGKNIYKEIPLSDLYTTTEVDKINNFSNVLAKNLKIKNIISSKYNGKYNMVSFTLLGENANINDFTLHLKDENLTIISPQKATYLGLIEKDKKNIVFYYFNTQKNNYQKIEIPVNIQEETISTQTNLNPEENTIFTPVNIFFLSVIAVLLMIFLIYQKIWLIFPPLLLTAYLIYINMPKGEMFLNKGIKIYILPTNNSTVFYETPLGTKVKILKKTSNYTKIQIQNKIGWVKNEDIK